MKSNDSTLVYNTRLVVPEENRVKGFDPFRFLKKTPSGPVMELKYKKLWFRLKYPNGRIKLSSLSITDQMAIIEARIYFDKDDVQPRAVVTAKSEQATAPGGLYIEQAQYSAVDQALTNAGFGFQTVAENSGGKTAETPAKAEATAKKGETTLEETAPPQTPKSRETAAEVLEAEKVEATAVVTPAEIAPKVQSFVAAAVEAPPVVETPSVVETPPAEEVHAGELPAAIPGGYTNEMSVEEICARMTLREAEDYIVPLGTCNGQTMAQVADRRPASLRYYMNGYAGDNNILRAAATMVSQSRLQKAS